MRMILVLVFTSILASGCDKKGDNKSTEPVDPIYGDWYYSAPGGSTSEDRGFFGSLKQDGTISFAQAYAYGDGHTAVFYVRKSIGKFERNGETFKVKYSYETCNPIKEETIYLKYLNGKLLLANSDRTISIAFARAAAETTLQNMAFIEDKNCNILSKIENKEKRAPANAKVKKSFFDRVIK